MPRCGRKSGWWRTEQSPKRRDLLSQRDRENSPLIRQLLDLAEARGFDQLVDFGLRPAAHDPWFVLAMAGKRTGDHFKLRVPDLIGVHQIASRLERPGQLL